MSAKIQLRESIIQLTEIIFATMITKYVLLKSTCLQLLSKEYYFFRKRIRRLALSVTNQLVGNITQWKRNLSVVKTTL